MHPETKTGLKAIVDEYFNHPDILTRNEMERMFRAFKARIIIETEIDGHSYQGVVRGDLKNRSR